MFRVKITFLLFIIAFSSLLAEEKKDSLIVYFNHNKSSLEKSEEKKIFDFIELFKDDSISHIYIEGHCDNLWSDEHNLTLSLARCESVKNNLLSVEPIAEFDLKHFGESKPIASNNSDEGKALNRRVLIVLTHFEQKDEIKEILVDTTKKSVEIDGEKIEIGKNIVLKNLNFIGGRHTLVQNSKYALAKLLTIMQENPTLEIEIQGHICCSPPNEDGDDHDSNDKHLSVNRAKAVYDHLVENSIDSTRMSYVGLKARFPLVSPERTEADKNKNRRVEIKILKY